MALPLICFPTAVSNSIASMTLPAIAELQASRNHTAIKILSVDYALKSLLLGAMCSVVFLFSMAVLQCIWLFPQFTCRQILSTTLAWICPFLYTNSIPHKHNQWSGQTIYFFSVQQSSPDHPDSEHLHIFRKGIYGYLIGLLFSQYFCSFVSSVFIPIFFKRARHYKSHHKGCGS